MVSVFLLIRFCTLLINRIFASPRRSWSVFGGEMPGRNRKEAGCPRSICVPPAPDSFAIVLISDDELIQCSKIEVELSPRPQRFDGSNKDEIGRSRTETRRGR